MKLHTSFFTLLLLGLSAGTGFAADKEQRQMMADIRMLQEQNQQLQNLIASLNDSIAAAVKAVNARVDTKIEEQANLTRKGFADQGVSITTLSSDFRIVREQVADNSVRLGTLAEEVSALRQIVTQFSTRAAADAPFASGDPDAVSASSATAPGPTAATVGASPTEFWRLAESNYALSKYDLAIDGFRAYITTFPGDKADDAQVYICKSYLLMGRYREAIKECDTAIRLYPTGDKIPEAYYRKGLAHRSLKEIDQARAAFTAVITRVPDGDEASLARQALQSLEPAKKP